MSASTDEWLENPAFRTSKYRSLTLKRGRLKEVGSERTHQLSVWAGNRKTLKSWKSREKPGAEVPMLGRIIIGNGRQDCETP